MKIVIVGSEGFIGHRLRALCANDGHTVIGIDVVESAAPGNIRCDIRSADLAEVLPEDADAVVHLAAVSRDQDCASDLDRALSINVGATWNVLEAARARGVPQMIFASSEWVYGDVAGQDVQREDAPIDVNKLTSTYAMTKIFAERLLDAAWQADPRTAVTVLRFGIVYGPRPADWSAVEHMFNQVKAGEVVVRGSLKTARRFIHVDDVCRGILSAVGHTGFDVFNISGDSLVSLADLIDASAALIGRMPTVVEGDPSAITVRNPDNTKARNTLGWTPAIDLAAGLMTLHGTTT
jgi:nucleoside-diphosphate-sugar epimerase